MTIMKQFSTLIKGEIRGTTKNGKEIIVPLTDWMVGKICGIQHVFCDTVSDTMCAIYHDERGTIITTNCNEENYKQFISVVEKLYPDQCEFYYNYDGEIFVGKIV